VADTYDLCAMTISDSGLPDDPNDQYINHHKYFIGGPFFVTKLPDKTLALSYTIASTRGCSANQILTNQSVAPTSVLYTKGAPKGHVESWIDYAATQP